MIGRIKNFLSGCPLFSDVDININFLGEEVVSGSVDNMSGEPVIKTYTDGGTLRQFLFAVSLRQRLGQDAQINSGAAGRLEQIGDWIENQSNHGNLPMLDSGRSPVSLEIMKTGWLEDKNADSAKYQLQCRLVYYQER